MFNEGCQIVFPQNDRIAFYEEMEQAIQSVT